ncbi:hypothetical protein BH23PLA1_BH23PLA1_14530 [soil metagenome]
MGSDAQRENPHVMTRTIVYSSASDADERRWLSASAIAGQLPRDRFEVREPGVFDSVEAGHPSRTLLLADSLDATACSLLPEAARRGMATALVVVDPTRPPRVPIGVPDVVLVESRWSADFLKKVYGIEARVLSPWCVRPTPELGSGEARYATFIDPIAAHGIDLFVRLADELGRRRPDIPLLVIEKSATEADLVGRGLDLRTRGNVHLMSRPADPSQVWSVTRLVIAPLLDPWVGGVLADAANNDIPIIASDHPLLRGILAHRAAFVAIPGWLTPCSRQLPDAGEVEPWVDAVLRCWDDPKQKHPRKNRNRGREHSDPMQESEAVSILTSLSPSKGPRLADHSADHDGWVVLVPFVNTIEPECESALRALETAGVLVVRCRGSSAIDHARSMLASESLRRDSRSVLFIDSDIAFDPVDALRLFARPEPVVAGVYTKKNKPALSSSFSPGTASVNFGAASPGLYPLQYAAAGFLRIHTNVLRRMIERLALPLCNTHAGEGLWPFFLPIVLPQKDGSHRYLAEDWAFSHRLTQIGITPLADTTIRLYHLGMHGYTWEDTLQSKVSYESFTFNFTGQESRR